MVVKLGSNNLSAFKVGSSNVSKIYKGNNLVYSSFPTYSELGYTRLWCVTDKNGVIDGSASSDSGKYAVKWWDNTTTIHNNNESFAKPHSTLLLHFDGNDGDTTTTDSSSYAHAITFNGDAEISTAQSKFGGSSLLLDGTDDYLTIQGSDIHPAFYFGGGDFTVEAWLYKTATLSNLDFIAAKTIGGAGSSDVSWQLYLSDASGGTLVAAVQSASGYTSVSATLPSPYANAWHHIAMVRHNNSLKIFWDGQQLASTAITEPINDATSALVYVGAQGIGGGGEHFFDGYIDDFHIVKGEALYTSNFTPPTVPASPIVPSGSGTRAFEIYPANKVVSDQSTNNLYGTFEGNVAISSDQSKWGGSSLYQPQSGGSIMIPYHPSLDIGTNDFTIEFWYYPLSLFALGSSIIVGGGFSGDPLGDWCNPVATIAVGINDNGTTFGLGRNCIGFDASAPISLTTNVWHHLAVTREGTTVRFFHNGQFVGSGSSSEPYLAQPNYGLRICDPLQSTINYGNPYGVSIDGYLDDVRIINGTALYTTETSFTVPSGPLTAISNTVLLLNFDSTSIVPTGQFDGFDVKNNSLLAVRAENVSLSSTPGYWGQNGPYWWNWGWVPGSTENGDLSNNNLSAVALDQFYTDLDSGTGDIFVTNNPGIVGDDPTIATNKGYTVFGSVPPSTTLLLNFNGNNGDTTTTDSSPEGHIITLNGDAEISTAQSKFGGSSLLLDGNGDYLTVPQDDAFSFGTGDFTMECWVRFATVPSSDFCGILTNTTNTSTATGDDWYLGFIATGWWAYPSSLAIAFHGLSDRCECEWYPSPSTWYHIAVSRQSGTVRIFIDGVEQTLANSGDVGAMSFGNTGFAVGMVTTPKYFDGYIDDVRIVKGHALYTSNFTPPSSQLGVYTWTP